MKTIEECKNLSFKDLHEEVKLRWKLIDQADGKSPPNIRTEIDRLNEIIRDKQAAIVI